MLGAVQRAGSNHEGKTNIEDGTTWEMNKNRVQLVGGHDERIGRVKAGEIGREKEDKRERKP